MSGISSVPRVTLGPNGYVSPDENQIFDGVFQDIDAAFGGGLNPSFVSPQGQLATSEAAMVADLFDQWCQIVQFIDPAYAQGRMQDGIARIYFLTRNPALPTVVTATCGGLVGRVIPAGSLAKDTNGFVYVSLNDGEIDIGGTVDIQFANLTNGPIPCATGALNDIYQIIPGWESITNASDGVLGRDVESRNEFEKRRFASVQKNSVGSLGAVLGEVFNVPGVLDAYVTENSTGSNTTSDSITILAHSIYVCVAGGTNADVAKAIFTKKAPGCNMTGATSVTVTDPGPPGMPYGAPAPTYTIKFQTAAAHDFMVQITLEDGPDVPSDALAQAVPKIIAAFSGADGGTRARIGSLVLASRYYGPIASLGTWVRIVSIKIATKDVSPSWVDSIQVGIAHVPTLSDLDISMVLV